MLREYVKDVRVEMTKVSWPTREELRQHTLVVVVMVILVAIFIGISVARPRRPAAPAIAKAETAA